jgi:hypothetical protein
MRKLPASAAEDLIEIVMHRYERASPILTSNHPFDVANAFRRYAGRCGISRSPHASQQPDRDSRQELSSAGAQPDRSTPEGKGNELGTLSDNNHYA